MPKLVADASRVVATRVLLVAAVGLLSAALGTGHVGLAWASVALSAVAAAMILRRWRRSWLARQDAPPEDELAILPGPSDAGLNHAAGLNPIVDTVADSGDAAPGEEQTDAADLLLAYELTDEVLVVDELPHYHLARCRRPDQAQAERLPVREARELGFTPCGRCRPDTTLARKYRAARASTGGGAA